jgi:uncharacterized protein YyaL (SSP411 family)
MLELFWDKADGGFFSNRADETELAVFIKEAYDGPIPSGNSIAAQNLLRLAALTDDGKLKNRVDEIFRTFRESLEQSPLEHTQMLCAVDFYLSPLLQLVLVSKTVEEAQPFSTEIGHHFTPHKSFVFSQPLVTETELPALTSLITDKVAVHEKPTVYICENYTCKAPITDLEELRRALSHQSGSSDRLS